MNDLPVFSILSAIAFCACATGSRLQAQSRTPEQDHAALIALENEWLANEHNPSVLERILASDFVHPLPTGDFVTKAQHIAFSTAHPPPANLKQHFDQMRVRVYGDVGIVNGVVVTTDERDHKDEVRRKNYEVKVALALHIAHDKLRFMNAPVNPNKTLWEKGDFTRIAETMRESGEALVQKLGITKGLKVLDLGCGDGTTALPRRNSAQTCWASISRKTWSRLVRGGRRSTA
jgi:hypothetical protein